MHEYYGNYSKIYTHSRGKRLMLLPALAKSIPATDKEGASFLDIGCGHGDLSTLARAKGYTYTGFDISPDMIEEAKRKYPHENFIVLDGANFAQALDQQFDVILINMVFPALDQATQIEHILLEATRCLADTGTIYIGTIHPSFDPYMQYGIMNRPNITTDFAGYFTAGQDFSVTITPTNNAYCFTDHHWPLQTYAKAIKSAGLAITDLNECEPDYTFVDFKPEEDPHQHDRSMYPTYLVLSCQKRRQ